MNYIAINDYSSLSSIDEEIIRNIVSIIEKNIRYIFFDLCGKQGTRTVSVRIPKITEKATGKLIIT